MKQKAFIAPVCVMGIIGLLNILSTLVTLYWLGGRLPSGRSQGVKTVFVFLWPTLAFAEAYIYWLIRMRITRKTLANLHVFLTLFASVILRWVLYVRIVMHMGIVLTEITIVLILLCFIVGHAFFITIISEAWSGKKPSLDNEDKNVHLLDDITHE
jgi:hypothetical protein